MKIGIIGTGNIGSGLARHLAGAGHDVLVGSRDEAKGTPWARISALLEAVIGKRRPTATS